VVGISRRGLFGGKEVEVLAYVRKSLSAFYPEARKYRCVLGAIA
jgi:hypothetical protein